MKRFDLADKVVLVTGAAGGIGFATTQQLHARGAAVALVDLNETTAQDAASRLGDRALGLAADVTDPQAIAEAVATTVASFGRLDVCIANAGIPSPVATARSIDPAAFDRVIEINLLGVWRTVRAALPAVIETRGQLAVVSSAYAFVPGMVAASYAASKAAVESLGRSLRIELAPYGVTVTTARFGFVETATFEHALTAPDAVRLEHLVPAFMRRRIQPEDAAAALVRGIERRSPTVIAPSWLHGWSIGRALVNPIGDALLARDRRLQAIITDVDRAAGH
jgi:NAD(P)-dependent dehydrogenase (short-subunit alcohol dehydrogenase family)